MKLLYITNSLIPSNIANSINVIKMSSSLGRYFKSVYLIGRKNSIINLNVYDFYSVNKNFNLILYNENKYRLINSLILTIFSIFNYFKLKPDILYLRNIKIAFIFIFTKKITILELHNSINNHFDSLCLKFLIKFNKKIIFICISEALTNYYKEKYLLTNNSKIIHTLHDASDDIFKKVKFENKTDIILNKKFNIGYFGSLYSGRGIELIVDIASRLPLFTFHIFGGTKEELTHYSNFKNNNIIFYGYVSPYQAEISMMLMDCLLAPFQKKVSVYGNKGDTSKWMSPLKIFNYMAAKKPIVVSDIPVLREVLKDNYNSILCNSEDKNEWIESIINVYESHELREYLSKNAYNDFLNKYSWDIRAKNIDDFVKKYEK